MRDEVQLPSFKVATKYTLSINKSYIFFDRDVSHAEGMGAIVPQSLSPILSGARNVVMRWRRTKERLAEMHTQEELNT